METLGDRIREARKAANLTQEQLALMIGGAGQSTIGNYERGDSDPSVDMLRKIALATGRSIAYFAAEIDATVSAHQDRGQYAGIEESRFALIPRYEVVFSAGQGKEATYEQVSGSHAYRRDWLAKHGLVVGSLVIAEVDGLSMYPTLNDGDIVLINRAEKKVRNGKIYGFRDGDEGLRLKRLFRQPDGKIRMVSDNPDKQEYPDEYLTPMDAEATMIGRIVHRGGNI